MTLQNVFLHLLNMSITAGWLVLAVVVLRLVFRRAPKWIHCLLWALVALRLLFPVSIESALSIIPSAETVPVDTFMYDTPVINSGVPVVDNAVNPVLSDNFAPQPENSANPMQVLTGLATYVWVVGAALMLLYAVISTLRLRLRVRESVRLRGNIYRCDRIWTPFILGILRPRIYLPTTLSDADTYSVVAHEMAHIQRRDHWWKPLGFLLLTVYWFNPLLWVGYVLLCRDIEAACDERVIRDMDLTQRKSYSDTLLACSAPRHLITACPLAFGETGVKSRIKSVLSYKKPAFWLIIAAVVATVVAAVCLLTNPAPAVSDELDAYLTHVILEQNYHKEHTDDVYPTEAHTVFGVAKKDGKTAVYGMVLYEEYYLDENGELQVQNSSHIPTVITLDLEGNGYALVEYWIPRDGTYYPTDIREKYPIWYWLQTDTQRHIDKHQQKTLADAKKHFGVPTTKPPVSADGEFSGWRGDTSLISSSLAADMEKHKKDDEHWQVLAVESLEEMNDLFEKNHFYHEGTMSETYDSSYFERNILLLVYYSHHTCNVEPRVVDVRYGDDRNSLRVWLDIYEPYMQSDALGSWLLATSVDREAAANITAYDACVRGSVLLSYYVAPYENAPTWGNIKSAPETWRDYLGEDEFELDEVLDRLNWADLDTQVNECTFVGTFNLHNKNYYVNSDYTLICTEQQVADLTKKDGDYFRALFQPRDDLRHLPPYRTQLADTIQNSANKPAKRNCWHTLSQPMLRSVAAGITGGYTLEKHQVDQLKDIVNEVDWEVEPEQYFDFEFDAYFSFDGSSRFYVHMNTAEGSFITNSMGRYAMLTKKQCDIIEELMTGSVTNEDANTFVGKVTQVTGTAMLMECYDKDKFNEVWVDFGNLPDLNPQVGYEYVVTHSDWVMETYPPQVTAEEITPVSSTPTINH